ncbi:hypothetical protein DYB32_009168 [Aphanomyces invadans]|uniref:Myb-like domain-containing protein n=1 Tax=Aphanomyces invadans TaxID=157072 RepID=A0A418AJ45_9STRA|nr:hypothetical protein DYB32_009168 [Aphanomyces invadans]
MTGGQDGLYENKKTRSMDLTQDALEKKWWTEEDDVLLLTQVNNERPFLRRKDAMKAWQALAANLLTIPDFSRRTLDGKKAQNCFLLLMRQHAKRNKVALLQSGVVEIETDKTKLLDDLTPLYNDSVASKKPSASAESENRVRDIQTIRESAMMRGNNQQNTDSESCDLPKEKPQSGKRKYLAEMQEMEIALEREKMAFEQMKWERELQEREKDRLERQLEREARTREDEAMMRIISQLITKK